MYLCDHSAGIRRGECRTAPEQLTGTCRGEPNAAKYEIGGGGKVQTLFRTFADFVPGPAEVPATRTPNAPRAIVSDVGYRRGPTVRDRHREPDSRSSATEPDGNFTDFPGARTPTWEEKWIKVSTIWDRPSPGNVWNSRYFFVFSCTHRVLNAPGGPTGNTRSLFIGLIAARTVWAAVCQPVKTWAINPGRITLGGNIIIIIIYRV